jgi:hypothetical protein
VANTAEDAAQQRERQIGQDEQHLGFLPEGYPEQYQDPAAASTPLRRSSARAACCAAPVPPISAYTGRKPHPVPSRASRSRVTASMSRRCRWR